MSPAYTCAPGFCAGRGALSMYGSPRSSGHDRRSSSRAPSRLDSWPAMGSCRKSLWRRKDEVHNRDRWSSGPSIRLQPSVVQAIMGEIAALVRELSRRFPTRKRSAWPAPSRSIDAPGAIASAVVAPPAANSFHSSALSSSIMTRSDGGSSLLVSPCSSIASIGVLPASSRSPV